MKIIAFSVAMLFCCGAYADDLADANKLLEAKSFSLALTSYTKLATAGNAEAQFHLGEMALYGEGMPADAAKAKEWFQKAAASGDKKADAALALIAQRALRKADIDFYVHGYKGDDVALEKFNCGNPEIPEVSQSKRKINEVGQTVDAWMECYNGFVQNLNAALPPGKAIPQDVEILMNEQEFTQAKALMDKVYAAISAEARQKATAIATKRDAWKANTAAYVVTENARIAKENDLYNHDSSRGQAPQGLFVTAPLPAR